MAADVPSLFGTPEHAYIQGARMKKKTAARPRTEKEAE
jgi:hypothetical protein